MMIVKDAFVLDMVIVISSPELWISLNSENGKTALRPEKCGEVTRGLGQASNLISS